MHRGYLANVALAQSRIETGDIPGALDALHACSPAHRNWEWGHLLFLCHQAVLTLEPATNQVARLEFVPDHPELRTEFSDGSSKTWALNTNNALYQNDGNDNHWLLIDCRGTSSNRAAIGTKVRVLTTIRSQPTWQMREISSGSAYGGQNDLRAHFGLADAQVAEIVRIEWPSGVVQELTDVAANQILTVMEPPRLAITPALILSWPIAADGYLLESAPTIDGPWTAVDAEPEVDGSQTKVVVDTENEMRFFRLRTP